MGTLSGVGYRNGAMLSDDISRIFLNKWSAQNFMSLSESFSDVCFVNRTVVFSILSNLDLLLHTQSNKYGQYLLKTLVLIEFGQFILTESFSLISASRFSEQLI